MQVVWVISRYSVLDLATMVCFLVLYEVKLPPLKNNNLKWTFYHSLPAQSASEY